MRTSLCQIKISEGEKDLLPSKNTKTINEVYLYRKILEIS